MELCSGTDMWERWEQMEEGEQGKERTNYGRTKKCPDQAGPRAGRSDRLL